MAPNIPLFKIYSDDQDVEAIKKVITSGMNWAIGSEVATFEQKIAEYIGTRYCVVFNSGTSALHAIMVAYDVRKNDEVIVPSLTFIATANAPLFVQGKPIFADIEEKTLGLAPEDVKEKISSKTKAMMPVHYGGCPAQIRTLREIADDHNILLIEDAAESLGINVSFYKILAFTGSAFFAGLAGSLYAQHPIIRSTGPSFFDATFSFSIIIFCVIGGMGSISGGAIGAFLMTILLNLFLNDIFHDIGGLDIFVYAALLIITLRYMPYGLVRATKDQKRACILGTVIALCWILIPISEGWGVDLFSNFLPAASGTIPKGDILNTLVFIFSNSVLTLVGKFDLLGQMIFSLTPDNFLYFVSLLVMFIISIPAMLIFLISEVLGLFLLQEILGLALASSSLVKARFIIYVTIGIPFAFYLPKIFKTVRLKYWGTWPSAGRYEPD